MGIRNVCMGEELKSFDVFYRRSKKSFFKVRARDEAEARVVADNILMKDRHWDYEYDAILEYDSTLPSTDPLPEPEKTKCGSRYVYRGYDKSFD